MRAQSVKRADPVNRSVNNIRLTSHMSDLTMVQSTMSMTMAEATLEIDYMKHNLFMLIYSIVENTTLEPYFHNI